jgi:hypothetical protein
MADETKVKRNDSQVACQVYKIALQTPANDRHTQPGH